MRHDLDVTTAPRAARESIPVPTFARDVPAAATRRMVHRVPLLLTLLRAALAPVLIYLAIVFPSKVGFGICLMAGFLSDVYDGIIARRLGIATSSLRRLDSITDTFFYLAASFAAWHLYPHAILRRAIPITILILLETARYAFDWLKFRREASYHMWSSKVWGISLFVGFFSLLALGSDDVSLSVAIYLGILADCEGLAISISLRRWTPDVPSLIHALRSA